MPKAEEKRNIILGTSEHVIRSNARPGVKLRGGASAVLETTSARPHPFIMGGGRRLHDVSFAVDFHFFYIDENSMICPGLAG